MSTPTTTISSTFSATSPPPPANYLTSLGLGYNLNVLMNIKEQHNVSDLDNGYFK
jgi:hypothetical protein